MPNPGQCPWQSGWAGLAFSPLCCQCLHAREEHCLGLGYLKADGVSVSPAEAIHGATLQLSSDVVNVVALQHPRDVVGEGDPSASLGLLLYCPVNLGDVDGEENWRNRQSLLQPGRDTGDPAVLSCPS